MKRVLAFGVLLLSAITVSCALAQSYPNRPMRVIVPHPAGGGIDLFVRVVAQKMSDSLGQPIVVDNRTGAQGSIGMAAGAKAPPDGYTLIAGFTGTMAINPFLYRNVGYDPLKDFAPVSIGTQQPEVLAAHPRVPAKTVKELVALARTQAGKLAFGTSAATGQVVVELFKQLGKVNVLHVPYKGAPQALTDLMGGHIDCAVTSNAAAAPLHKTGKLHAIVTLGPDRTPVLPDVPSSSEAGMPGLQMFQWYAIVAPAATPKDIVAKLNGEMQRALAAPDVVERLTGAGLTPRWTTPEEFAAILRKDHARYGKVLKDAGLSVSP